MIPAKPLQEHQTEKASQAQTGSIQLTMPLKFSALFTVPLRLPRPSVRHFSITPLARQPEAINRPRLMSWADTIESSRNVFADDVFEAHLKALKENQPTLDAPGEGKKSEEEDKRVELAELVQTQHRFAHGDAYAPHDLSFHEQRKRRARKTPAFDAMDLLGINPIKEYRNFSMMSEYMTEMGRIKHSRDTGLRPVNQRRMAKAIRRAIGLGLMPAVHRHPEVMGIARPDKKFIAKTW